MVDDIAVNRTWIEMFFECACPIVPDGAEEGTIQSVAVPGKAKYSLMSLCAIG